MRVANVRRPGNRSVGVPQLKGTTGLMSMVPAAFICVTSDDESMVAAFWSCCAMMCTVAQELIMNSFRSVVVSPDASSSVVNCLMPGIWEAVDGGAMPADM